MTKNVKDFEEMCHFSTSVMFSHTENQKLSGALVQSCAEKGSKGVSII